MSKTPLEILSAAADRRGDEIADLKAALAKAEEQIGSLRAALARAEAERDALRASLAAKIDKLEKRRLRAAAWGDTPTELLLLVEKHKLRAERLLALIRELAEEAGLPLHQSEEMFARREAGQPSEDEKRRIRLVREIRAAAKEEHL